MNFVRDVMGSTGANKHWQGEIARQVQTLLDHGRQVDSRALRRILEAVADHPGPDAGGAATGTDRPAPRAPRTESTGQSHVARVEAPDTGIARVNSLLAALGRAQRTADEVAKAIARDPSVRAAAHRSRGKLMDLAARTENACSRLTKAARGL